MSKSKSKKNQKTEPEEQAQEIVVDVPRETSFIPDEEFSEESKLIEHQPYERLPKPVPGENKEPKRQTYQEIMADRARQQKLIILRNVERNKAIQEARAKKFKENVEAKKKR